MFACLGTRLVFVFGIRLRVCCVIVWWVIDYLILGSLVDWLDYYMFVGFWIYVGFCCLAWFWVCVVGVFIVWWLFISALVIDFVALRAGFDVAVRVAIDCCYGYVCLWVFICLLPLCVISI